MPLRKWRGNTRRENRIEELGRVDAEKADSKKGKKNLKEEKSRIRKELATGGTANRKDRKEGGLKRKSPKNYQINIPKKYQIRTKEHRGMDKKGWDGKSIVILTGSQKKKYQNLLDRRPSLKPREQRDILKKGKPSPGSGGRGKKAPDKRWNKGDKFMTPLKQMVKTGRPKIATKGWK